MAATVDAAVATCPRRHLQCPADRRPADTRPADTRSAECIAADLQDETKAALCLSEYHAQASTHPSEASAIFEQVFRAQKWSSCLGLRPQAGTFTGMMLQRRAAAAGTNMSLSQREFESVKKGSGRA